jgi:hypothetical protein
MVLSCCGDAANCYIAAKCSWKWVCDVVVEISKSVILCKISTISSKVIGQLKNYVILLSLNLKADLECDGLLLPAFKS